MFYIVLLYMSSQLVEQRLFTHLLIYCRRCRISQHITRCI